MNTLTIAGFRWLERLGSGACGEVHRLCPVAAEASDRDHWLVCKVHRPGAVDAALLTRQWRRLEQWGAPAALDRPLWWQWDGDQLLAFWPDTSAEPRPPAPATGGGLVSGEAKPGAAATTGATAGADEEKSAAADKAKPGPGPGVGPGAGPGPVTSARVSIQPRRRPEAAVAGQPDGDGTQPATEAGDDDAPSDDRASATAADLESLAAPPDAATALRWTAELLEAGAWLHRHGLVHGNLKSRHVRLRPAVGGGWRPVLLDAGTGAVGRVGSLEWTDHLFFMPPDQLRRGGDAAGQAAAVRRGDVHAMGVVLFRLWTGQMPRLQAEFDSYQQRARGRRDAPLANLPVEQWQQAFAKGTAPQWPAGADDDAEQPTDQTAPSAPAAAVAGRVPVLLGRRHRQVIERCLEPDPARRWPDLEQAWAAWRQADADEADAGSSAPARGRGRTVAAAWRPLAAVAAVVAAGALGYAAMLHQQAGDAAPRNPAAIAGDMARPATGDPAGDPGPDVAALNDDQPLAQAGSELLLHLFEERLDGHRVDLPASVRQPLMAAYREQIARLEQASADQTARRIRLARALEIHGHLLWLDQRSAAADTDLGRAALVWQRLLAPVDRGALTAHDDAADVDAAEQRLAALHESRGLLLRELSRPQQAHDQLLAAARLRNGRLARAASVEDRLARTRAAGRSWLAVAESRRDLLDADGAASAIAEVDAMLTALGALGTPDGQAGADADAVLVWLKAGSLHQRGLLARSDGDAVAAIDHQHQAAELLVEHIARAVVVPVRFQRLLGQVYTELAEVLARVEGSRQAIEAHGAAIRHLFAVLDAEPGDRVARLFLARNYGELALIERDVDQLDEARRHLETAVLMLDELVDEPASRPRETLMLAVLQALLAEMQLERGDDESARELIESALARVTERLDREEDPLPTGERTRWRLREAELTGVWAGICLAQGDRPAARQALQQAVERWRDLRRTPGVDAAHAQRSLERNRRQLDELMEQMAPGSAAGRSDSDDLPDDLPPIPDTPELPVTPPSLPPPPLLIPQPPP